MPELPTCVIAVQTHDFDYGALYDELRRSCAGQAGAIVCFAGLVRDFAPGQDTDSLYLEHYPGMCERELQAIADEAFQRWAVQACRIVHRVGELARGDQIVFAGVASAHRGDAFQAAQFIMDALKTRAPFWKRETLRSGERIWVEARDSDQVQAQQWDTARPSAG